MPVSVGRSENFFRANLVEVAGEKQEAKKRFSRFALPREEDSDSGPRERSAGIRLDLGESLW